MSPQRTTVEVDGSPVIGVARPVHPSTVSPSLGPSDEIGGPHSFLCPNGFTFLKLSSGGKCAVPSTDRDDGDFHFFLSPATSTCPTPIPKFTVINLKGFEPQIESGTDLG